MSQDAMGLTDVVQVVGPKHGQTHHSNLTAEALSRGMGNICHGDSIVDSHQIVGQDLVLAELQSQFSLPTPQIAHLPISRDPLAISFFIPICSSGVGVVLLLALLLGWVALLPPLQVADDHVQGVDGPLLHLMTVSRVVRFKHVRGNLKELLRVGRVGCAEHLVEHTERAPLQVGHVLLRIDGLLLMSWPFGLGCFGLQLGWWVCLRISLLTGPLLPLLRCLAGLDVSELLF
mmetsp:Transcript_132/g.347  ORF Transcript_132/g.347 Transcript_132/m.347 type:complete len:232 (-) Transcript_132:922-1617(-)